MGEKMGTNIYQVDQHSLEMHMESDKCHKYLIQSLYLPYNNNVK